VIRDFKPYTAYKDSGLRWVGSVPAHWTLRRAKYFYKEVDDRSLTGDEELMSVSHLTGVTPRSEKNVTMFLAESNIGHKLCQPGDLVINTMWAWMAALGVARHVGLVSPSYGVYRPLVANDLSPDYVDRLLRTAAYASEYTCRSTGVNSSRLRLYPDEFLRIPILSPPEAEQTAIVRFLDHMDRRIGRYIHAKQKLMKLLGEQKQALIYQAVTHGLNASVRFKPSGTDWLGDVPEHWQIQKLKHLARFHNGFAFKPGDWSDQGVPIIRIQNLNGSDDFNYTILQDLPVSLRIQPGDLLFAWSGNRGTSFGSFIWDRQFEGYLNQHIFKLAGYSLDRRYFAHLLRAVTRHVEEQTHGIIGLVHITKPELGAVSVPVAPLAEQVEIAKWIDTELDRLESAASKARREIALLREYRTRLVADVVTGKLDVREAAANLPDEVEDPDKPTLTDDALAGEDDAELTSDELAEEGVVG
jgi:type I restriction enzyme, S subunit